MPTAPPVGGDRGLPPAPLGQASIDDKVRLLAGESPWSLPAIPELLPRGLRMVDGPSGAKDIAGRALSVPCGTALAATFDPRLVRAVGGVLGREARRAGARMLLGPTVNLHRNPLGGRNFESFSEDPLLTAVLAAAYVQGVQSQGVAACIKHFVCNESEHDRFAISSQLPERVLRELYLAPFAAAVRYAGVRAVMAAYNRVNGTYASEHRWLLTDLLREEWGFEGVVLSDWGATHSTVEALLAGLDVEMPGPPVHRGAKLLDVLQQDLIDQALIDQAVQRVVRLGQWVERARATRVIWPGADTSAPRAAGTQGAVLLKNESHLLPLTGDGLALVALIGPLADCGQIQGGGSSAVADVADPTVIDALQSRLPPGAQLAFERGVTLDGSYQPLSAPLVLRVCGRSRASIYYYPDEDLSSPAVLSEPVSVAAFGWSGSPGAGLDHLRMGVRLTATLAPTESGTYRFALVGDRPARLLVDGEQIGETSPGGVGLATWSPGHASVISLPMRAGGSYQITVERPGGQPPAADQVASFLAVAVTPPAAPDQLERAVALAAEADAVVLLASSMPDYETEGHDRPSMRLPGRQDELIERVAAANPRTVVVLNTGSPVELPWLPQVPALLQIWYPGRAIGHVVADVLTGRVNPSGKLPSSWYATAADAPSWPHYPGADGLASYREGLLMGYRAVGRAGAQPLYPFGFGLSYTTFALDEVTVSQALVEGETVFTVGVTVGNTGQVAGREVVQVYAELADGEADRAVAELKGFAGIELRPGRTGRVQIPIPLAALRIWREGGWQLPGFPIHLRIGTSSRDTALTAYLPVPNG